MAAVMDLVILLMEGMTCCHVADKQYILKKCPYLLNEMITTAHQLFFYDQAGRGMFAGD